MAEGVASSAKALLAGGAVEFDTGVDLRET